MLEVILFPTQVNTKVTGISRHSSKQCGKDSSKGKSQRFNTLDLSPPSSRTSGVRLKSALNGI
jgi:hypothetical protein